jgi:hypothetical protein
MKFGAKLIMVAGLTLLPAIASAQTPDQTPGDDVVYCRALSSLYVRYIGHDWQYGNYARFRANNDAQVAVTKCHPGGTAFAIPVLERELIANKFTLPSRG